MRQASRVVPRSPPSAAQRYNTLDFVTKVVCHETPARFLWILPAQKVGPFDDHPVELIARVVRSTGLLAPVGRGPLKIPIVGHLWFDGDDFRAKQVLL